MTLPIPILWKLQLMLKQKVLSFSSLPCGLCLIGFFLQIALTGVFSLGLFVTVIQIIRIFTIAVWMTQLSTVITLPPY